jgi:hypothetical protein
MLSIVKINAAARQRKGGSAAKGYSHYLGLRRPTSGATSTATPAGRTPSKARRRSGPARPPPSWAWTASRRPSRSSGWPADSIP